MNKLNITGNTFPLTVENLKLLQDQNFFLQTILTSIIPSDPNFLLILKKAMTDEIIGASANGELFEYIKKPIGGKYYLVEKKETIITDNQTFSNVRSKRYVIKGPLDDDETYLDTFENVAEWSMYDFYRTIPLRNNQEIEILKTTTSTAQTTASTAQTTANAAQTTANAAQTTARAAQTTARAAQTTANNALITTDEIKKSFEKFLYALYETTDIILINQQNQPLFCVYDSIFLAVDTDNSDEITTFDVNGKYNFNLYYCQKGNDYFWIIKKTSSAEPSNVDILRRYIDTMINVKISNIADVKRFQSYPVNFKIESSDNISSYDSSLFGYVNIYQAYSFTEVQIHCYSTQAYNNRVTIDNVEMEFNSSGENSGHLYYGQKTNMTLEDILNSSDDFYTQLQKIIRQIKLYGCLNIKIKEK